QQWAQFSAYANESHEVDILEFVNKKLVREEKYSGVRFRSLSAPEIDERIRPINGRLWHTYSR
ncbi:hypothetical protein ACQKEK_23120, partial [Pseudomonas sp. NPDC077408]